MASSHMRQADFNENRKENRKEKAGICDVRDLKYSKACRENCGKKRSFTLRCPAGKVKLDFVKLIFQEIYIQLLLA